MKLGWEGVWEEVMNGTLRLSFHFNNKQQYPFELHMLDTITEHSPSGSYDDTHAEEDNCSLGIKVSGKGRATIGTICFQ